MRQISEPIVCPVLIGRNEQVDLLQRLMSEAEAGNGRVVLLAGEAGIGKSRLVSVANDIATNRGWRHAQGNFFEQDRALPFSGLIDLIRGLLMTDGSRMPEELASVAPEIVRLVPELDRDGMESPPVELDPEQDRRRLYEAFGRVFLLLASDRPALVVLEDLHWADDASLGCLAYLCRLSATHRLVLLLTYRAEEVSPSLAHL